MVERSIANPVANCTSTPRTSRIELFMQVANCIHHWVRRSPQSCVDDGAVRGIDPADPDKAAVFGETTSFTLDQG
jgi:hypothetical protein